jgi:hypothetical protein
MSELQPRRFQRRRIKGYRLPPGTVCVTRGTYRQARQTEDVIV